MSHGFSESFSQVVLLISASSCGEYPVAPSPANVLTISAARSSHAVAIRYDSSLLSLDEADGEQIFIIWPRSGLIILL